MAVCPICQHDSLDLAHCDLCDAALSLASALPRHFPLEDGRSLDLSIFDGRWPLDFASTRLVADGNHHYRVHALERGWYREMERDLQRRASLDVAVLPPIRLLPCGEGVLVLARTQGGASPLPAVPDCEEEWLHLERTLSACEVIAEAMGTLHDAGLLWLTFDPEGLEATEQGVRITALDLGVTQLGAHPVWMRPAPAFAAPEVVSFQSDRFSPASDVFSLAAYAYYRLARLAGGFAGRGLPSFDFEVPLLRTYRPWLPIGIAPVIERALQREPARRPATPREFVHELRNAIKTARERQNATGRVIADVAGASVVGRVHVLHGQPNQDRFAIVPMSDGEVYIVADGVTHALIGSGDLASETAVTSFTQTLTNIPPRSDLMTRARGLVKSFEEASQAILNRALKLPLGRMANDPTDLMSTTAVVAMRHGRELLLGSAGDSRAYLVRDGVAEQLTVDGDLGTIHLSHGTPPEQVREMGAVAMALYRCLGVSQPGPQGLILDSERCQPDLTFWPLLPGDTLVLCTDGLVETGAFLAPEDLVRWIDDSPAGEQVQRLISAAVACHQDPTEQDPTGLGDDVTCIVVRILPDSGSEVS